MKNSTHILDELRNISPAVAEIPKVNVFQVPEGYFDSFQEEVSAQISKAHFLPKKTGNIQSVPEGYFESLPQQILNRIKNAEKSQSPKEELDALAPAISAIGNKNIFSVPEDYFTYSENNILAATVRSAKVVHMRTRIRNIWKYAVAAVLAGIISYLSLTFFSNNNEMQNMASQGMTEQTFQDAMSILENDNFDQVLASVSDQDIASYLENRGLDVEAALVASTIESESLPEPEDYLFNENTLNEFLTTQNLQ